MKKSLIALALMGAFSGAAFAQSNVTLYGIIDLNVQRNDPNGNQSATTGVNSGHQSGSRWGLRGSEALGGGLNAIFTIEGGYGPDTGVAQQGSVASTGSTSVGRLWGRQAWAGLSGGFGSVVLGRLATFSSGTGSFDMFGATDPFLTGFGDSSLGSTFTSAGALRIDNVIAYVSPNWGGFKFGAGYSFNIDGPEGAGSSANNTGVILGANFTRGPFFASVTYDIIDPACTATSCPGDDQTHLQIGATFDLKFLKIHGGYAIEENIRTIGTANSTSFGTGAVIPAGFRGRDADAWMVGLSVPLAGGTLMASYQDRDADSVTLGTVTTDPDLTVYAIAYSYPLSRRTNLYANWSNRDGGGTNANNAVWDRKQYTIGMRHLF